MTEKVLTALTDVLRKAFVGRDQKSGPVRWIQDNGMVNS